MRQDRPRPCASYPLSYAYTAYSCDSIFISFSRCPRALDSFAAALLSPARRWSQLLTHTPAARIPTCPSRLLVRTDALVPPAHPQRACLRAARYRQTSLADRHIQETAAHDLVPFYWRSAEYLYECNRTTCGSIDLARAHRSRYRTHIQHTRAIKHSYPSAVVPPSSAAGRGGTTISRSPFYWREAQYL